MNSAEHNILKTSHSEMIAEVDHTPSRPTTRNLYIGARYRRQTTGALCLCTSTRIIQIHGAIARYIWMTRVPVKGWLDSVDFVDVIYTSYIDFQNYFTRIYTLQQIGDH